MMTDDTMTLLLDQIQASTDGDFLRAIAAHREHKIPWGVGGWVVLLQASRMNVISNSILGMSMRVQIQLRIVTDDDNVLSDDVIACFDGSVRSQGSLPKAPPVDRFPGPF
jgi:hypothetical protein